MTAERDTLQVVEALVFAGVVGGALLLLWPDATLLSRAWLCTTAVALACLVASLRRGFRTGVAGASVILVALALAATLWSPGRTYQEPRGTSTRAMIRVLERAIETYHADHGAYPPSDLQAHLDGDPTNGGPDKAYVRIRPTGLRDAWGAPLRYRRDDDGRGFDLWSTGDPADPRRIGREAR